MRWLERQLSRSPSSGAFIPEVDGMRFLAILGVLVVHTAGDWYFPQSAWSFHRGLLVRLMGVGWFGVQIFFVLSGFIVTLPFARHHLQGMAAPDLKRYLMRRLTRIEPPYVLALTAYYLSSGRAGEWFYDYLAGLFYSHHYLYTTLNPVAPITWSLEIEIVFYVLAPWLTLIYRFRGRRLLQILLIVLPAWISSHYAAPGWAQNTFVVMIQYFFAGMLLADLYASGILRRTSKIAWDLGATAAAIGIGTILAGLPGTWVSCYWLTPILIMILFAGILSGRYANWFFRLKPVTIIGGMCYTLYLSHMAVIAVFAWRIKPLVSSPIVYCLLVIPFMIALAVPVYLLIEKPFMAGKAIQLRGWLPYRAAEGT